MFFRVNHVVLSQQAVSSFLYHLILTLRALQIVFNIFYGINITDEFNLVNSLSSSTNSNNSAASNFSSNSNSTNSTNSLESITSGNNDLNDELVYDEVFSTFKISDYLVFSNFHYYAMKPGTTESEFLLVWAAINGAFVMFLLLLISVSGRVFEASKTGDLKETTKILLKGLSIVMCVAIQILPIPIIAVNL